MKNDLSLAMNSKSVFLRLALAFATLIAITVGVGWLGLNRMALMNAEVNEALEKRYAIMTKSQNALTYSSLNNRIVMQVFLVSDKSAIETLLAERAANSAKISGLVRDIRSRLDSEEEKGLLVDVERKRTLYVDSYTRAFAKLKADSYEEARLTLINETVPRLVAYRDAWSGFVAFQAEQARREGVESQAKYVCARKQVIGMVVVAVVLAGAIGGFATKTIAREIHVRQEAQNALCEASEKLEGRVKERTEELNHLNAELMTQIEHRKQAEVALSESEIKFRSIFESSQDAIVLLSSKGFYDCNPRALEMFGFEDKEEFVKLDPPAVSPPVQPDGKDSVSSAASRIKAAIGEGSAHFEWMHRRSNGQEFPADVLLSSFEYRGEKHIHATVRDITERKSMERALAAERDRFQNLMDFMPDVIYFKDRQSRFTLVNAAFARTLGFACPEDAVGKTDQDIFGDEHSKQAFEEERKMMATGEPIIDLEEREDHLDGRVTWVSTTKVALRDGQGRITGMVGISRNITERKKAEAAFVEGARKYQMLIESVSDWVWETNANLEFVYSNPRVAAVLGYGASQILGRSICDFVPGVEQLRMEELYRSLGRTDQGRNIFDCLCLRKDGDAVTLEMNVSVIVDECGQVCGFRGVARDVTERRRIEDELLKLTRALDQSPASVLITNTQGRIEYVNAHLCEVTGYTAEELIGKNPRVLKSEHHSQGVYQELWEAISSGRDWRGEICNRKKNGEIFWESVVISPLKNEQGRITHYLGVKEDITERKRLEKERETMEIQLRQAQKLESVGQLAAGIAHEINTPIQYVGDNLRFIQESFADLSKLLVEYERIAETTPSGVLAPEVASVLESRRNECDVAYLVSEIPTAVQQSLDGVKRVADIVRAMKEFSHPGSKEKCAVDINHAIETTITVARNEWKYVAEMVTEFAPDLPMVTCFPDEFNQVILNLLVNAAQAIGEVVKKDGGKGTIKITTKSEGPWVEIRIADTGAGIREEHRSRIFELFFTTKEVGKGTGQGLALARSVIVKKHGGEINFESAVGKGTTFIIRIPVSAPTANGH